MVNDLHVLPRLLEPVLEKTLRAFPVVVLSGARQTGKTTLVRHRAWGVPRTFRTLDDLRVLERAEREPEALLDEADVLTLDEVQRAPSLLVAVKRLVDDGRRPGRFLLTGSANLLLMKHVSESLAGRAAYLHLGPMTQAEKEARAPAPLLWSRLLDADDVKEATRAAEEAVPAKGHWTAWALEGGYPPVLPLSADDRARWFDGYVATYLERDLRQLAEITNLADFRRLIEVSSLRVGGLLNVADLARDAGLSRPTAHRYVGLLEVSFQVRLLRPYAKSRTKRLVKTPKLYWTDTGLAAHLAGLGTPKDLREATRSGVFLENVVLSHLDTWRETLAPRPEIYFYRTATGVEVDFVIEQRRRLLPVEVKASTSVRAADAEALEAFLDEHAGARFGVVVHAGDDVFPVTSRVVAVPARRLV
jgi:predicted AAA+ superfamily ATPase